MYKLFSTLSPIFIHPVAVHALCNPDGDDSDCSSDQLCYNTYGYGIDADFDNPKNSVNSCLSVEECLEVDATQENVKVCFSTLTDRGETLYSFLQNM